MARRKKSLNELNAQIRRIANMGTGSYKDIALRFKANKTYNRYVENIQRSKQFQKDWDNMKGAGLSARQSTVGDRKYSQNVYMGLSNG